jgi:hypothetical protein
VKYLTEGEAEASVLWSRLHVTPSLGRKNTWAEKPEKIESGVALLPSGCGLAHTRVGTIRLKLLEMP